MITLVALYSFSRDEVAQMLRASRAWVNDRIAAALDALSEIFLRAHLLREDRPDRRQYQVTGRPLPPYIAAACDSQGGVRGGMAPKPAMRANRQPEDRYHAVPA